MPRLRNMNLRPSSTSRAHLPGGPGQPQRAQRRQADPGTPGAAGTADTDRESQRSPTGTGKPVPGSDEGSRPAGPGRWPQARPSWVTDASGPEPGPLSGQDAVHVHLHRPTMYACSRGGFMFGG
jgi:hypothetical protein